MKTEHKIFGAIGVLVVAGGLLYMQHSSAKAQREAQSSASVEKPGGVSLNPEDVPNVTKLEFDNAEKKEKVVLEKVGAEWNVTAPIKAKANKKEVEDLLKSLEKLKVVDTIDRGTGAYAEYDVADNTGIHFVAYKGNDKAIDVTFGKSGTRGQTVRIGGKDGVYTVSKDEYKGVLFGKVSKDWRDKTLLDFKDTDVASIDIENAEGHYVFTRDGDNWKGKFDKNPNAPKKEEDKKPEEKKDGEKTDGEKKEEPKKDGEKKDAKAEKKDEKADPKAAKKDEPKKGEEKKAEEKKGEEKKGEEKKAEEKKEEPKKDGGWEKFDGKNVETLIGAFKNLKAHDFAESTDTIATTGLDAAAKEGGIITFKMKDGTEIKLIVGKKQKGSSRFAKKADADVIFVIAQYPSDWVTAAPAKFEKKDAKAPPGGDPHGGGEPEPEPEPEPVEEPVEP